MKHKMMMLLLSLTGTFVFAADGGGGAAPAEQAVTPFVAALNKAVAVARYPENRDDIQTLLAMKADSNLLRGDYVTAALENQEHVSQLLQDGLSPDNPALLTAISNAKHPKNDGIVQRLISLGVSSEGLPRQFLEGVAGKGFVYSQDFPPLHEAAYFGDLEAARRVLPYSNLDAVDSNGRTALNAALCFGRQGYEDAADNVATSERDYVAMVNLLVNAKAGVGPHLDDEIDPATLENSLPWAVCSGNLVAMQRLLDLNADPDEVDPLFSSHPPIVDILRSDLFCDKNAALQLLINANANLGAICDRTDVQVARNNGDDGLGLVQYALMYIPELVTTLIAAKAPVEFDHDGRVYTRTGPGTGTPLSPLVVAATMPDLLPGVFSNLLNAVNVVDVSDETGVTALHSAVRNDDPETVQALCDRNASIFSRALDGSFPMATAILTGREASLPVMVNSAPVHASFDGELYNERTLLHLAANKNNLKAFELLLPKFRTLSHLDGSENSLFNAAAATGNVFFVTKLIAVAKSRGATAGSLNCNVRNSDGNTALHTAVLSGVLPSVKALQEFGADQSVNDGRGNNSLFLAWKQYVKASPADKPARLEIFKLVLSHAASEEREETDRLGRSINKLVEPQTGMAHDAVKVATYGTGADLTVLQKTLTENDMTLSGRLFGAAASLARTLTGGSPSESAPEDTNSDGDRDPEEYLAPGGGAGGGGGGGGAAPRRQTPQERVAAASVATEEAAARANERAAARANERAAARAAARAAQEGGGSGEGGGRKADSGAAVGSDQKASEPPPVPARKTSAGGRAARRAAARLAAAAGATDTSADGDGK